MGGGKRHEGLFGEVRGGQVRWSAARGRRFLGAGRLDQLRVVYTPLATHLKYRVGSDSSGPGCDAGLQTAQRLHGLAFDACESWRALPARTRYCSSPASPALVISAATSVHSTAASAYSRWPVRN